MKFKLYWLPLISITVIVLMCGLFGLAFGQGPVLTTLPTPTPAPFTPDAQFPSDQISAAALPDLIVTNIETTPATPKAGQPTTISVTVKNNSATNLNSGNNFLVDLYIDPPFEPVPNYHQIEDGVLGLPWGVQSFWVPAGQSYVLKTTWVFTDVKTFEVWAQVDSGGNVYEAANENNNTKMVSISVLTTHNFKHDTHQDFLTNMASTLDNSDPNGRLRLGRFIEPPFFERPFTNASCEITSSMVISDYNMANPDTRLNSVATGNQENVKLIANGKGVVVAVWQDGRTGNINDPDIYLRYSTDYGATWTQEQPPVNDDGPGAIQLNPVAALSEDGILLVAWQDRRSGNYDIYAQKYILNGNTLTKSGSNILVATDNVGGEQINPDIAVDKGDGFHVVWQDGRNNSYDIFATSFISGTWTQVDRVHDDFNLTQQVNPTLEALDWLKVEEIVYAVDPSPPYTVTVTGVISEPATVLVVTWEDDRKGSNTDIAMVASGDRGETFGKDQFLTNSPTDGANRKPDVTLTKGKTFIAVTVPITGGSQTVQVEVPVSKIHTVWEGYNTLGNSDLDIYYNESQLGVKQLGTTNRFDYELTIGTNEKINKDDIRAWQTGPVEQKDPALTAVRCGSDTSEDAWNVFITWADGRNYDSANYDIYYDLKSTCGAPVGGNQMLNDGVRLHKFDTSNPNYSDYNPGNPPPGYQVNPSVAADIQLVGSTVSGGYLYLAWQDDRAGNPQQEKDVYFARSNLTFFNQHYPYFFDDGAGSQISNILDSGSTATIWYTLGWSATTDTSTYLTVQTRLGNTIAEVLNSPWYPQRFPFQPRTQPPPGDCFANESGAPLPGYDAPGQHIEGPSGNFWPKARYIQYRVNFYTRNETHTPELDSLTLYYQPGGNSVPGGPDGPNKVYLPIVLK